MDVTLGERLIQDGSITETQLHQAIDRQRTHGGRLGENMVALGLITREELGSFFKQPPPVPQSIQDTGLEPGFVLDLALKHAAVLIDFTLADLGDRIKLVQGILDWVVEQLRKRHYLEVKGASQYAKSTWRFTITDSGKHRAGELMELCRYVGPAPVPLEDYRTMVELQTIKSILVSDESLGEAFSHLVVNERMLKRLGPAVSSGKAIFLYGPPGNGKTSIAETIGKALPGTVYMPYAVQVGGEIILVYDPVSHVEAPPEMPPDRVDQRYALIERPVILAGGELTLKTLDLDFNPISKFYEAPLQMKANNGLFIVDDFGRQQIDPRQLLNRWIVPLERHTDFLTLHTGMKFEIPFDQLVIFSTNIEPKLLVDEAFLRRTRYKIKIDHPTQEEFEGIFRKVCAANGVPFDEEIFEHLIDNYYRRLGVKFNACHPRDIIEQVVDEAHYHNHPPKLTPDALMSAWDNYFVEL